ncbi:hypothetical protein OGQ40_003552 [Salmonella enterica subsp. enterica serovar Muenchen]|nr:hypothetical protein [Escherichia coli O73]EFC3707591.1 hypothetical protein [Escherichia coli]EJN4682273.1 hypothetical protein [Salmonella enterica subsp. enterica serovar Muenchen]EJL5123897.1 hypothetical protein [Escherichia coli]EJV4696008.1 hypothetical protein [Escherichia coli]
MLILDCSSRSQALFSLSSGFGCSVMQLKKVLLSLDLEQIYETDHSIMIDSQQYLREYVCRELGSPGKFSTAYWFHGTRTSADNTFESGLLPLNQTESLVMDMLVNLAPDAVVKEKLQAWNFHAGVPDNLFRMRTRNEMHWGPYGHLVREVHLHARKLWQHNYLRLPELVEDVCNAYQKKYGQDLTEHYLKVLKPCIVCFRADIEYEKGALEAALSYGYTSVRELPPDSGALFGIDRHGISVSLGEIVNIEFTKLHELDG